MAEEIEKKTEEKQSPSADEEKEEKVEKKQVRPKRPPPKKLKTKKMVVKKKEEEEGHKKLAEKKKEETKEEGGDLEEEKKVVEKPTEKKKGAKKVKKVVEVTEEEEKEEDEKEDEEVEEEEGEEEEAEEEEIEIVEEEEGYKVKIKPQLSDELKSALKIRNNIKKKTPNFKRQEWHRYKRLGKAWRKPRGLHSKTRKHKGFRQKVVSIGYGSPARTRNLHSSGFKEVLVYNVKDLEKIDPKSQAARVGHSVGTRKRIVIEEKAEEKGIRVLNPRRF